MSADKFTFKFTKEQLKEMLNGNPAYEAWYNAMLEIFPKYDIITIERVAGFVAQCAHESRNFMSLEENLNYKEDQLLKTFGRYFGPGKRSAKEYARNPEKIANYVYMDEFRSSKMGNVKPGDGWLFRGRGLKQLTGRENYTNFGKSIGITAEQAAEYVATPKGAIESACWFWNAKRLNAVADSRDIVRMTKIINGGDIGLADRRSRWESALRILSGNVSKTPINPQITDAVTQSIIAVKRGSNGETVKKVQAALGLKADGVFGVGTETSLKIWQTKNGLTADGVAGPITLAKLLG